MTHREPVAAPASLLGLAHVASCSFLASRLAPSGQFWCALGGGIALAQAGARHGLRAGYGASLAAIVQTVAIIGPARVNGPLTQALNAPLAGRMQAAGRSRAARILAVLLIRLAHYAVLNVLIVALVFGGIHEYVASYDKVADFLHVLPNGTAAAIGFTVLGGVLIGLIYSTIQVFAYDRALRMWPADAPRHEIEPGSFGPPPQRAEIPWTALGLTAAAWIVLLISPAWPVLGVVAAGLAIATVATPARHAGREVWGIGVGLAAVLAFSAIGPAIIGAVEWEGAGQRAIRAALLVLTATWTRAASGAPPLREAARRSLLALHGVPSALEAAEITEDLASDRRLLPAARSFLTTLKGVPTRPLPVADALTAWVAAEAAGYRPPR